MSVLSAPEKLFPGKITVFCLNCRVACVIEDREMKHVTPDIWVGEGTCWNCKRPLPKFEVQLYGHSRPA